MSTPRLVINPKINSLVGGGTRDPVAAGHFCGFVSCKLCNAFAPPAGSNLLNLPNLFKPGRFKPAEPVGSNRLILSVRHVDFIRNICNVCACDLFEDMTSRSVNFESRCPAVGCSFVGHGTTLSSARRSVRGHALVVHRARFVSESLPLQTLTPEQLEAQTDVFRRGQMATSLRRRRDQALLDTLLGVSGAEGGPPIGASPGLRAGSAQVGVLPAASTGQPPDLSAGQFQPSLISVPATPPTVAPYQPPRGYDAVRMADFIRGNTGRRPSSMGQCWLPSGVLSTLRPAIGWKSPLLSSALSVQSSASSYRTC